MQRLQRYEKHTGSPWTQASREAHLGRQTARVAVRPDGAESGRLTRLSVCTVERIIRVLSPLQYLVFSDELTESGPLVIG